jgi:hypothetical protein
MTASWENFQGDTNRVCLQCRYRWPLQVAGDTSVTDEAGCPECGYSPTGTFVETTATNWDKEELLLSAHLDVEIYAGNIDGVQMGWLKDEIDKLLMALASAGLESTAKLTGSAVSDYKEIAADHAEMARELLDEIESDHTADVSETIGAKVSEFLRRISGRRAAMAQRAYIAWDEDEHRN